MSVKQISIFVENQTGLLSEVTTLLADTGINLRALSIADTSEFGILRVIVEDVEKAAQILHEHGNTYTVTNVLAVKMDDRAGGLAAILETLEYYTQHKDEFRGRIMACFVSDEEGLSKGTYQLVEEGLSADYAIMAECRYDNVAIGFRGRYSFEVTVHGTSAHASHYPAVGENALITGGKLAAAIEALPTLTHPNLKHGTWCVRYMEGGNAGTLVVPDSCYIFVDRYVVPGETDETCIAQIMEAAKSLGLENKVDVRLKPRTSPYMQSFALDAAHPLVTTLQANFTAVTGEELPVAYDPSVCDSNILAVSLNIPTVTFGPSGGGMHADNEYGYPYQVKNCVEIYRRTVADLLK